jgi:hypothetical protein
MRYYKFDQYSILWSGDLIVRKTVIVAWSTVCSPLDEGGLGIRSLSILNQASNLKLFGDLMNSDNHWAVFLRSRVVRESGFINYHIFFFSLEWIKISSSAFYGQL